MFWKSEPASWSARVEVDVWKIYLYNLENLLRPWRKFEKTVAKI